MFHSWSIMRSLAQVFLAGVRAVFGLIFPARDCCADEEIAELAGIRNPSQCRTANKPGRSTGYLVSSLHSLGMRLGLSLGLSTEFGLSSWSQEELKWLNLWVTRWGSLLRSWPCRPLMEDNSHSEKEVEYVVPFLRSSQLQNQRTVHVLYSSHSQKVPNASESASEGTSDSDPDSLDSLDSIVTAIIATHISITPRIFQVSQEDQLMVILGNLFVLNPGQVTFWPNASLNTNLTPIGQRGGGL